MSIKDNLLNFIDKMEIENVPAEMRYGYYHAIDKFRDYIEKMNDNWINVSDGNYPSPKNKNTYLSDYVLCLDRNEVPCICSYDNINNRWIEKGTMKKMYGIELWKKIN